MKKLKNIKKGEKFEIFDEYGIKVVECSENDLKNEKISFKMNTLFCPFSSMLVTRKYSHECFQNILH